MTDFLKIAKSIAVHFAHICAYGVETVNNPQGKNSPLPPSQVVSNVWYLAFVIKFFL